jgi:restriction system protein
MSIRAMIKGFIGETMGSIAHSLMLDKNIYHEINNVTIQAPDGTTQIDHVIVSRYGIFVIEAKNMSGWIFGGENDAQWTQSLPGGGKFRFQSPLRQNYRHTKCLSEFLGIEHNKFHSVVMFWGESKFKTTMPPNVLDSGYTSYIKSKLIVVFDEDEVSQIVESIQTGKLPRTWSTRMTHIDSLNERHSKGAINQPINELTSDFRRSRKEKMPSFVRIAFIGISLLAIWLTFTYMQNNQQIRIMELSQKTKPSSIHQQVGVPQQLQSAEILNRQQPVVVPEQPRYERLLIRGKSARECARPDGTLDNYTVQCMKEHYEMVLVK